MVTLGAWGDWGGLGLGAKKIILNVEMRPSQQRVEDKQKH